jgi:uncharacterized protein
MSVGLLILQIQISGCKSLKEKRSHLKPLIHRIHREFNVSIAETDNQDKWNDCILTVSAVSNNAKFNQIVLNQVINFVIQKYPDLEVINQSIEMIY